MAAKQEVFINNSPPQCKAENLNSYTDEINAAITAAGITLSDADVSQLRKALVNMSLSGTVYNYSGSANSITLSAKAGKATPTAYIDGMRVLFFATVRNTGAVTVNLGSLGVKSVKASDGSELVEGDIDGFVEIVYDITSDYFTLALQAGAGGGAVGGGKDKLFFLNDQKATADFIIPSDKNAMMSGPLELEDGVTIVVETGGRLAIV